MIIRFHRLKYQKNILILCSKKNNKELPKALKKSLEKNSYWKRRGMYLNLTNVFLKFASK
jgi:hypothetical protein